MSMNMRNQKVDQVDLPDSVFAGEVKDYLFGKSSVASRPANGAAPPMTKEPQREVAYSGKKLYRQKGTGRARAGSPAQRHPHRRRHDLRPAGRVPTATASRKKYAARRSRARCR
jgi:ribosomal protein L4